MFHHLHKSLDSCLILRQGKSPRIGLIPVKNDGRHAGLLPDLTLYFVLPEIHQLAASIGKQLAIVMAIIGIFINPFLILIAIFVYLGADQEYNVVMTNTLLEGIRVRDIMTGEVKTVNPSDTADSVLKLMFQHKHMGYPVIQDGELKGIITFHDISKLPEDQRDRQVEEFMTKRVVVTDPQEEVASTLEKLTNNRIGRLPVLENSQLVGIISKTDVMKALEMKKTTLSQ